MAVTEILASVEDINTHLPTDKLDADAAEAETDINLYEVDAARLVRSLLSGTFTAVQLSSWDEPANTPDLIRGIAGRLIAAKYYSVRYAEDSDISDYAQGLYNEAIAMLKDIRNGNLVVVDINEVPLEIDSIRMDSDDFWPNDSADAPKFSMGQVFF